MLVHELGLKEGGAHAFEDLPVAHSVADFGVVDLWLVF